MPGKVRQRLRVTFTKGEELKFISHLDLMRLWERALRRARVPLAYAHRFNPRPRLALASPLPLGFTSQGEVMDLFLESPLAPLSLARGLKRQLPPGIELVSIEEVYLKLPSLQSQVVSSEYQVKVRSSKSPRDTQTAIESLLASPRLPVRRQRKGREREYDLRPLILELRLEGSEGQEQLLAMHLETSPRANARPEEVLELLGLGQCPRAIQRQRLNF